MVMRNLVTHAGQRPSALLAAGPGQGRLRLREPRRRRRLDLPARPGPQADGSRPEGRGDHPVRRERARGRRCRARHPRARHRGCKIVFTTSFGYMNPTEKVATSFPNVEFFHATGYKTAKNVGIYNARFYEGRYLNGVIAGKMTKTHIAGYVAAFPIPEVLQGINAFTAGHAQRRPQGRGARHLGELLVRSGQGARGRHDPASPRAPT